jgi:hypothetical protein
MNSYDYTTYTVADVKADPNRKNTQKMVDFLKDKKFAGGIRPLVRVEPMHLQYGDIDVIIIENSRNTPFYLTDQFEGVRANSIYTRIMDTNTPLDKSADINNVEYLWRKRFYLDEMPIEKFHHYLLDPDDWEHIQDNDSGYYYKYAPEYTLASEKDDRDGYEYYMFSQTDSHPSWWLITLRYHQTAIGQYLGISLDGGRAFVVAPRRASELLNFGIASVAATVKIPHAKAKNITSGLDRCSKIANAAPTHAPEETPKMSGETNGFWNIDW